MNTPILQRRRLSLRDVVPFALVIAGFGVEIPSAQGQRGAVGGVYIDAAGVLRQASSLSQDERLELLRQEAVGSPGSVEMATASQLRKVSLRQLEAVVRQRHDTGGPLPADIRYLAGLQSVRYLFLYPASGDVVLAGPAESWKQLPTGEVVGNRSNRPVLHLEDLIVALRYAFAKSGQAPFIGCSIEPTADGMKSYVTYMNRLGRIDRSKFKQAFAGMAKAMGQQSIRLFGVPASSRYALKLVAADYRLKRIALGHDPSPVREVTNYLDLAAKRSTAAARKQHRWWFIAEYDAIVHSPDQLAFEFQGQAVKVATAPNQAGSDAKSDKPSLSARQFSESFTRHFPAIAAKMPIFAELQNLIGLSVAAELIAQHGRDADGVAGSAAGASAGASGNPQDATDAAPHWKPTHFLNTTACPIQKYSVPARVPSIVNYRLGRGRNWIISVSGGVQFTPRTLTAGKYRKQASDRKLTDSRTKNRAAAQAKRWWWD